MSEQKTVSEENARFAIDGAIAYGRMGINEAACDHWLREYWEIGRKLAQLEAQLSKPEPVEYQYRMRAAWLPECEGWGDWTKCSEGSYQDYLKTPIHCKQWQYEVRKLFAAPVADNTAGEDAARLDWMQRKLTGASDSARYLPFRVYWGQSKNIRAAIDKARGVQQEGGKAE